MTAKRYFEFSEGTSNKFWEVWKDGTQVFTRYGKIGASGQVTVKDEGSDEKAQKLYDKLVREKTGKGYQEKGGGGGAAAAPAKAAAKKPAPPPEDDEDEEAEEEEESGGGASAGARRFEFSEGSSNKFWEISLDGSSYTVRYGKIGTDGQEKTKDFASPAAAKKEYDKLIAEKTGKGYTEVGGGGAAAPAKKAAPKPPPDEDEDEAEEEDEGGDEGGGGDFRRFEFSEGDSNKFWEIKLDGSAHTVRYGKIGTDGQEKTKDFGDDAAAKKDYDKLIAEKTKKGYTEV